MSIGPGASVGRRYELVAPVGEGGMATAWRARDTLRGGEVVVKLLSASSRLAPLLRDEFWRLRGLVHPHLVRVHDFGSERREDGLIHYYTADLIAGTTLAEHARRCSFAAALAPLLDALRALSFLHRLGIRHGDFKPENVLVDAKGRGTLIDLGCARPLGSAEPEVSGTPAYLAPELLRGEPGDARSDIFAAGVTLETLARLTGPAPVGVPELARRMRATAASERPGEVGEVLELLGGVEPEGPSPGGFAPRLLGRDAEIELAQARLDALLGGTPGARAVGIVGPAGSGKSRLLAELKWMAQLELEVTEAFGGTEGALLSWLQRATGRADVGAGVEGVMLAHEVLRGGPPRVLILDDVGRLTAAERGALEAFVRLLEPDDATLLLYAGERPLDVRSPATSQIELGPLPPEAVAIWVGDALSPRRLQDFLRFTGRLPSYVRWTLSELEAGTLEERELGSGSLAAARAGLYAPPPTSAVAQRVLALFVVSREALDEREWSAQLDPEILTELVSAGWLTREERAYRLAREADRGALITRLPPELLAHAHTELAAWLAARIALSPESRSVVALRARQALHEALAGRERAAEGLLLAAGDELAQAPHEWAEAAEAIARTPRRPETALAAARALRSAGRPQAALSLLARLLRTRPARRWRPAVDLAAGDCYLELGALPRAVRCFVRARRGPERAIRLEATERLAAARLKAGAYEEAAELAAAGLAERPSPRLRTRLHGTLGLAKSYLGDAEGARAALDAASGEDDAGADPRSEFRTVSYAAIHAFLQGDLARAAAAQRAALEIAERNALTDLVATAALNWGTACHQQGELGSALAGYSRGQRVARALGKVSTEATLAYDLANLYSEIGCFDRARRLLDQARRSALDAGLSQLAVPVELVASELCVAAGDTLGARAHLARAEQLAAERPESRDAVETDLARAELELALDHERAAQHLERSERGLASLEASDLEARALRTRARLCARLGQPERARELLERAVSLVRERGLQLLEAELETHLAELLEAAGLEREAGAHRDRARRGWDRVAATLPAELADAFWSHPRRRAFLARSVHAVGTTLDLRRVLAMNRRLNSTFSVTAILDYALDAALELSGAERGFVLLVDERGEFEVAAARGLARERVGLGPLELSRGIAERVIREEAALFSEDALADSRLSRSRSVHAMQLATVACVPISSPDGVLGALYLDSRVKRAPLPADVVDLLQAFAEQAAIAVRNARLHAALERRSSELEAEKRKVERLSRSKDRRIEELSLELSTKQQALEHRYDYSRIVGRSGVMRELLDRLDRVIEAEVPVLLHGESGTGKELVARAIHYNGPRKERPFLAVNCAALPEALLESELFGHVRGAFTGADRDKPGLFTAARGGTLFLDELGELPLGVQAKLLRVLQEREVRPLGSEQVLPVDVRLLTATNRDLAAEVEGGRFREDLYFRVAVVDLWLPPLRDRVEDIPLLAKSMLERIAEERGTPPHTLAPDALRALMSQRWPGNVRQLENVLIRASVLASHARLSAADLDLQRAPPPNRRVGSRRDFERDEANRILEALRASRWNVSEVSRALGIPRNTLYRKLKRHGIQAPEPAAALGETAAGRRPASAPRRSR